MNFIVKLLFQFYTNMVGSVILLVGRGAYIVNIRSPIIHIPQRGVGWG
jgi:hypothetical protein